MFICAALSSSVVSMISIWERRPFLRGLVDDIDEGQALVGSESDERGNSQFY